MDVPRHDADLAGARGDDSRTVRADQLDVVLLQHPFHADHVEDRNAFGDRDDQVHPAISSLEDGVGGEGGGDEDTGHVAAGLADGFGHGIKNRHWLAVKADGFTAATGGDAGDDLGAVFRALLGVEAAGRAGQALDNKPGIGVDKNAHGMVRGRSEEPLFREVSFMEDRHQTADPET